MNAKIFCQKCWRDSGEESQNGESCQRRQSRGNKFAPHGGRHHYALGAQERSRHNSSEALPATAVGDSAQFSCPGGPEGMKSTSPPAFVTECPVGARKCGECSCPATRGLVRRSPPTGRRSGSSTPDTSRPGLRLAAPPSQLGGRHGRPVVVSQPRDWPALLVAASSSAWGSTTRSTPASPCMEGPLNVLESFGWWPPPTAEHGDEEAWAHRRSARSFQMTVMSVRSMEIRTGSLRALPSSWAGTTYRWVGKTSPEAVMCRSVKCEALGRPRMSGA